MNTGNIEIVFGVSNDYLHVLRPACFLFNEFWSPQKNVKIVGFDAPAFSLPDNFEFISLGKQRGPKLWSNDMIDFYSNLEDDFFYSIWEDAFILKSVDSGILNVVNQLTRKDKKSIAV